MRRSIIIRTVFIICICIHVFPEDFSFDINKISNPRTTNGWITVIGGYIPQDEITAMNSEIDQIEQESGVEIAVVVVPDTGGDIFTAAQDLFDRWGIGKKDRDNGLLILVSVDEHQVRTHTGYGMEETFNDATIKVMQDAIVIPEFKKGNYGKGLLSYLKKIHSIISDPSQKNDTFDTQNSKDVYEYETNENETAQYESTGNYFLPAVFLIIGLLLMIFGFMLASKSFLKIKNTSLVSFNKYTKIKELEKKGLDSGKTVGYIMLFIFGSVFFLIGMIGMSFIPGILRGLVMTVPGAGILSSIALGIYGHSKKKKIIHQWRNDPRSCPKCGKPMNKLDEVADDQYLNKLEQVEEKINSMDYDVWICSSSNDHTDECGNITIEKFKGRKYGFYTQCPHCNSITGKHTKTVTVEHPSYTSTGLREIRFECLGCNKAFKKTEIIPRLERSTSSGSGSSGSSFSSSSSSGSSSFGGGSSGGGGATSSW